MLSCSLVSQALPNEAPLTMAGDGMTTNMITAARLIAHKSINGKYQSTLQMDKFPVLGHQMVS
jgi:hypothetical protein